MRKDLLKKIAKEQKRLRGASMKLTSPKDFPGLAEMYRLHEASFVNIIAFNLNCLEDISDDGLNHEHVDLDV